MVIRLIIPRIVGGVGRVVRVSGYSVADGAYIYWLVWCYEEHPPLGQGRIISTGAGEGKEGEKKRGDKKKIYGERERENGRGQGEG